MYDQNLTSLPDLHGVPVFYPHGTQLIWISQNGEITKPNRETLAAELAMGGAAMPSALERTRCH